MDTAYLIETVIKIVAILTVFSALAGLGTYFERKVLAFMQRRLGPMVVGPYGLAQVAADGIKLFTKEDIIPTNVVGRIFKIAPVITAATAFMAAAAIPFMPSFTIGDYTVNPIVADVNVGVLYVSSSLYFILIPFNVKEIIWVLRRLIKLPVSVGIFKRRES